MKMLWQRPGLRKATSELRCEQAILVLFADVFCFVYDLHVLDFRLNLLFASWLPLSILSFPVCFVDIVT